MSKHVYEFDSVIVRRPARSVVNGLRDGEGPSPTYEGVASEHDTYIDTLRSVGVKNITILDPLEEFPDSIFVEDPALVFTEGAILLRPGHETRIHETPAIEADIRALFDTVIQLPEGGVADGGDVLVTPEKVMIGLSARTDQAGGELLIKCLEQLGKKGEIAQTPEGILHFKTACSLLDDETIFMTERMAASDMFDGFNKVIVPAGEEAAANALRVNDTVLVGSDFPKSQDVLSAAGYNVKAIATGQIGMIDAGLSCMSLRWWRG